MHPFAAYLQAHNLEPLTVSIKAGVRYATVWNAARGNPITPEHARKVQRAVLAMTGTPYTGTLAIIQEQAQRQPLAFPVRKIRLEGRR